MRSVLFGNDEICYSLERKKVKNINLRIKQSGEVYVSAPLFVCTERIDSFVLQNAPKILAAKKRFEAAKAAAFPCSAKNMRFAFARAVRFLSPFAKANCI